MIEHKTKIGADFTFFAVIAMFIALDTTGFALMSLAACLIHEAGHLFAMFLTGRKPAAVELRGGGIRIDGSDSSAFVLISGSAVNIVLFFVLYFTLPKTDIYPVMFAVINLMIGLFNLLPIGCLDGKRLLSLAVSGKLLRFVEIAAVLLVLAVIILAIMRGGINFTIAGVMIYVLTVDFFDRMW
jgi:Zn-dependent protease